MSEKSYLDVLNEEQLEAVQHKGSPLLILAGAGSGKTRVITTKIAWLIANQGVMPEQILAVTFTNKAAKEMSERATNLKPQSARATIRTFHSFGAWILRRNAEWTGLSPNFTIYDDDDATSLLLQAQPRLTKNQARAIIKKISRAKDYCLLPDSPGLEDIDSNPKFIESYKAYQQRLKETGNVDFGDLIMLPVFLLEKFPQIRMSLQNRFSVIMVDEYQDSNIAQFEFLKALTGENTYLCVVGDDDQSIYKFRGAEVQNILNFQNNFENTKIIRLEKNYRSYAEILDVANSIVKHNSGRLGKNLQAERGRGQKPEVYYLPNQDAESELCSQLILQAVEEGGKFSDWAILYRTNAQSLNFETDFLHKQIPYKVIGTLKFYEREEIKDALAFLAFIANGRDEVALRRIINKPARGIGEVSQKKIINEARRIMFSNSEGEDNYENLQNELIKSEETLDFVLAMEKAVKNISLTKKAKTAVIEFLSVIKELNIILKEGTQYFERKDSIKGDGLAPFIFEILERSKLGEHYKIQDETSGTQKTANLTELANTATLYDFSRQGLTDFLEHIELDRSLSENNEEQDSVNLITIHNTKGLEFNNVIITGLETGVFPRDNSDFEELEEERRLMYVACTRAKNELYMTSCSSRRLYGTTSFMQPSRFLFEIESDLVNTSGMQNFGSSGNFGSTQYSQSKFSDEYSEREQNKFRKNTHSLKDKPFGKQIDVKLIKKKKISHPLEKKWKKGLRVYHSDYGYGGIVKTEVKDEQFVIIVQFENMQKMKFMPEYQACDFTIIED